MTPSSQDARRPLVSCNLILSPHLLASRRAPCRQRLENTNQLVKQMIDRLRLLLDALNMWDAHQTQLAQAGTPQQ